MGRRHPVKLHQTRDHGAGACDRATPRETRPRLFGGDAGRQHEPRQGLVLLTRQGRNRATGAFEADPMHGDRRLKMRIGPQQPPSSKAE